MSSILEDPPELDHHVLNLAQLQAVPHLSHSRTADVVDFGHHFICTALLY